MGRLKALKTLGRLFLDGRSSVISIPRPEIVMLWWVLRYQNGDWEIDAAAETSPSPPESVTDLSVVPEEHLHLNATKEIVGAEVLGMSASAAIIRAEDLRRAATRFSVGTKDAVVLRWYDPTGKTVRHEEILYDVGISLILVQHGAPYEIALKHLINDAIHSARYRRVDHRTTDIPPPTQTANGTGTKAIARA